ncbi:hypothetical protein OSB04_000429 [Centaurea solstitialis]|uniref:Uncharacterized protein n=1 Tax=Centaurea solstitialis TaxID=347529 RepID=A0AA38TP20_9ASTR|nr:hypothetical protein OSB04_000429 [Centaurea solstitialis]
METQLLTSAAQEATPYMPYRILITLYTLILSQRRNETILKLRTQFSNLPFLQRIQVEPTIGGGTTAVGRPDRQADRRLRDHNTRTPPAPQLVVAAPAAAIQPPDHATNQVAVAEPPSKTAIAAAPIGNGRPAKPPDRWWRRFGDGQAKTTSYGGGNGYSIAGRER